MLTMKGLVLIQHFFLLLLISSCLEQAPSKKPLQNSAMGIQGDSMTELNSETEVINSLVTPTEVETLVEESPPEPLIDGSSLMLYTPKVANLQEADGSFSSFVRYNTSGETDYIKYKICPLEETGTICPEGRSCSEDGACVESLTPELGFVIPGLYSGKVEIILSACVSSERALPGTSCGEEVSLIYNSNRVSLEIATLLHQRAMYEEQASALILEHKNYLRSWADQGKKCMAQNAEVEAQLATTIAIVEEFIKGPIEFFPKMIFTDGNVYESFTEPLTKWFGDMKAGITEACKNGSKGNDKEEYETCATLGMLTDIGSGIVEGMFNPIPAVGYLIGSINALTDPENSIPLVCNQDKKLSTAHLQYESRKTILTNHYAQVKAQLTELGAWID